MMEKQEISIEFITVPGFDDLATYEAIAEGLVQKNQVFFENFDLGMSVDDMIANKVVKYEDPRHNGKRQLVGDAGRIIEREKATCLDWAAFVAGYARAQGKRASVVVVPVETDYGEVDGLYHALVESDSGLVDVCTLLPGYDTRTIANLPKASIGACCIACAYDGTLSHKHSCDACTDCGCSGGY